MKLKNPNIKSFEECPDFKFAVEALSDYVSSAREKFTKGQMEHGGSIFEKPLLGEMKNEIVDQMFYFYAISEKRNMIVKELKSLIEAIESDQYLTKNEVKTSLGLIVLKLENL